jgi:hypothetical protein
LKDPSLCEIEQKDLGIPVRISRVFCCHVTRGFKNYKPSIAADASTKRLAVRVTYLADHRVSL